MLMHDETQTLETKRALEAEASYLAASTAQLRKTTNIVEEQNERLRELIARKQALTEGLERALAEARTERRSIEREVKRVLRPARRHARTTSEATR